MRKTSSAASFVVLALLLLETAAYTLPIAPAFAAVSACTPQTSPFTVTGATWGTAASPVSVYPGDQNVLFTVTMLFSGPCTSPQTTFELNLASSVSPVPFTGLNGNSQPSVVALNTNANTLVTETFHLNVAQSATTGVTYYVPMIIQYDNNTASSVISETTTAPIALYGPVQLNFAVETSQLVAGVVNNVTLTTSNSGSAAASQISTTASGPVGVTLFNQLGTINSLSPGDNATQVLQVFVSATLIGAPIVLTFTAKYIDGYFNSQVATATVGFTISTSSVATGAFMVQGSNWATTSSPTSPLPGTQDAPLVVDLQYLGAATVASLQGTVQLPSGFTDLNGRSTAVAYSSAATNQYGALALTFYVDIASSARAGSYNFTLSLTWMTSQSSGLSQTVVVSPPPVAALQSSFQVESAKWGSSGVSNSTVASPVPGTNGETLAASLQYLGTTSITNIKGVLALPTGITDLTGSLTATAYAATATPGQVVTLTFYLDIGSGIAPGVYTFPIELSWLTSVSVTLTQSGTVTPPPIASPSSSSFGLSIAQQNSTVVGGSQTAATFTLTNGGSAPIYSPTFSILVGSPLVLTSIGSTVPTAELTPGRNATFVAHIASDPSSTPGIYSGTLSVVFADSSGTSHSQSFPVSFTLEGTVVLILQDAAVSQTVTGFTVTGSILNEGSVPAYYASITGLLGVNFATPVYLGEIDPNTPLPFSVTVPFTAPISITTATSSTTTGNSSGLSSANATSSSVSTRSGSRSANFSRGFAGNFSLPGGFGGLFNRTSSASAGTAVDIALSLSFKDTFGTNRVQAFTVPTTVKTASELSGGFVTAPASSSGGGTLKDVAYGVVGVLVASLVAGTFMLRRRRAKALANLPADRRGEQSVI